MKHAVTLFLLALAMLLQGCGVDKRHFKIEGKFRNFNAGELYVYSPDGAFSGMDTLKVEAGRFAFTLPVSDEGTLMLVFPNFVEQPVFVQPGKVATIEADVSHLKEMRVEGTKDNELMTKLRRQLANASPDEVRKAASQFVADHPESLVGQHLVRQYFLASQQPDYAEAARLIALMQKEQPDNGRLKRMQLLIGGLHATSVGQRLPAFKAPTVGGTTATAARLQKADVAVVTTWASWSFESQSLLRHISTLVRRHPGRIAALGISLEASAVDTRNILRRDSISFDNVWSGLMTDDPTLRRLGLGTVPDNLVMQRGRIVARSLRPEQLKNKLDELLGH